jgi:penicillin-binding protein 2
MKTKSEPEKILILCYLVIAAFLLLVMRLWQLQILQGNEYRKLSEANRLRIVNIPAPRGIIFDRNGTPLVKNSPYCYASVIPGEFDKARIDLLAKVLGVPVEEIYERINVPAWSICSHKIETWVVPGELAYIEARDLTSQDSL